MLKNENNDIIFIFKGWNNKIVIKDDSQNSIEARVPIIVSASRATDIPAFYADWFFDRLKKCYVRWRNPFNGKDSYVSFANTRFIVFWSKNPRPLIPHLAELKERGIGCYIQYTLNDYEREGLEPRLPSLQSRIETFKELVGILGEGSVVWRFDPLVLTETIGVDELLNKIAGIADRLDGAAEKMVFSFADVAGYKKVGGNLTRYAISYREWTESEMQEFAEKLSEKDVIWNLQLATCAEPIDLSPYGIAHNKCIDDELISRLSPGDPVLQMHLFGAGKDKGQRKPCGCIQAKDLGAYNTCPHLCRYCYANSSEETVLANYHRHMLNPNNDSII